MSSRRIRTPGNNPETRIFCDWFDPKTYTGCTTPYVSDWDAKEARARAKALGWKRRGARDLCPTHEGC